LLFLSFIWICGLRLACEEQNRKSVLRDVAIVFASHISISGAIQFLFRAKHHSISMFFREDLLLFAMQSLTLATVLCIFAYYVVAPETGKRRSVLLRFLGDISYPLYLIHIPVFIALSKGGLKNAVIDYLIACAVAAALYWVVDVYSKRRHLQLPATRHAASGGAAPTGTGTEVQNLESSAVKSASASSARI
jgi:peptidoglycan/LPS O-acetylase OafA/YrhL